MKTMDTVWVTLATTDSGDNYVFVSKTSPERSGICRRIWECEGETEDLQFYEDTTAVRISELEVEE